MQFTHTTLIAALLATIAAASPIHQKRDCYDGPYVIYARGTSTTAVGTGPVDDPTDVSTLNRLLLTPARSDPKGSQGLRTSQSSVSLEPRFPPSRIRHLALST